MGQPTDNPIARNRSVANPTDAAMMMDRGTIRPGMTVRDLITDVFRVSLDAPAEELAQAVRRQMTGSTMQGKAQAMGQPAARPQSPPMQQSGLEELLGEY